MGVTEVTWDHLDIEAADRAAWDADGWQSGVHHCLARVRKTMLPAARPGYPPVVVDIGCGTGRLLAPLAAEFPAATMYGLDPSAVMLGHMLTRTPRAHTLCGGPELIPGWLSGAYSVLTFQHLPAPIQFAYVKAAGSALTEGGRIVVQFVPECDPGPLSNPVPEDVMFDWLAGIGMEVEVTRDPEWPTWAWAEGVKL